MRDCLRTITPFLILPFLLSTAVPAQRPLPLVRVGVVIDGPWERNPLMEETTKREVQAITAREFDVRFPPEATVVADWSIESIQEALNRVMTDPDIDVVITWGLIASDLVCRRAEYPKPVIAPAIVDVEIQNVPFEKGAGGAGVPATGGGTAGPVLFVEARNLLDESYESRGIYAFDFAAGRNEVFLTPAPGRNLLAGLEWAF